MTYEEFLAAKRIADPQTGLSGPVEAEGAGKLVDAA